MLSQELGWEDKDLNAGWDKLSWNWPSTEHRDWFNQEPILLTNRMDVAVQFRVVVFCKKIKMILASYICPGQYNQLGFNLQNIYSEKQEL